MSDRYWDVRSCMWQGGTVEVVPDWGAAPVRAGVPPTVPAQPTSDRVEAALLPARSDGTCTEVGG